MTYNEGYKTNNCAQINAKTNTIENGFIQNTELVSQNNTIKRYKILYTYNQWYFFEKERKQLHWDKCK